MKTYILPAARILLVMTILTGVIYPIGMTFLCAMIFPYQSNGSMIVKNGNILGSELIGQKFISDTYFNSRPSAIDYSPMPSSGTNWGPTDKRMADSVQARKERFIKQNNLSADIVVPKEMLFASASGVDPHISPEAVQLQLNRIVKVRQLNTEQIEKLKKSIKELTEDPQWKLFGDPRVNVLKLNLLLDDISKPNSVQSH